MCGLSVGKNNIVLFFEILENFDFKVLFFCKIEFFLMFKLKDIDREFLEIIEVGEFYG